MAYCTIDNLQRRKYMASWMKRSGNSETIREILDDDWAGHGDRFDWCVIHGSLAEGGCSCENNSRPSDTIRRKSAVHFQLQGKNRAGDHVVLDGCGQVPCCDYYIDIPVVDNEGNPVYVGGSREPIQKMTRKIAFHPKPPVTRDISEVTCGNCIRDLRAALKHHDKMEARAKKQ